MNMHSNGVPERTSKKHRTVNKPALGLEDYFIKRIPVWKRFMDIVGSMICLVGFLPIFVITAIVIKLTSKGPIIFEQTRSGLGGKSFACYKFRSMVVDAESKKKEIMQFNERKGPVFKMKNDPRITWIGKYIRSWSIDEFPQFYNVLKGDMSLVGPRPPTVDEVPNYYRWQQRRLEIKPGITCLWQVYSRADSSFEDWVRLDIEYQRKYSFFLDLKILILTIPAVLSRKGAH